MQPSQHLRDKLRSTLINDLFNRIRWGKQRVMRRSDGERILLDRYIRVYGKVPNLNSPKSFSEKLLCRMLSLNRNPSLNYVADKFAARTYAARRVGEQHLVKLLWHGHDPGKIPFESLPEEYVIKTNHAYNQVIVVKDNPNRTDIINKISVWLKVNYYWSNREGQYYHIEPRIMIEEYLKNQDGSGPLDYKFWCFNGKPEVVHVDNFARSINPFFDMQWNLLDLHYREGASRPAIGRPKHFEEMLFVVSQLSANFDFVRVDLYNIDGQIYFGECTLTPTAGESIFRPAKWDLILGEKWQMRSIELLALHALL